MVHSSFGLSLDICEVIEFFFFFYIKNSLGLPCYSQRLTGITCDSTLLPQQMYSCLLTAAVVKFGHSYGQTQMLDR